MAGTRHLVDYNLQMAASRRNCLRTWQTALDANHRVCHARPFPVFGCTNVIFIFTSKARNEAHFFFAQAIF